MATPDWVCWQHGTAGDIPSRCYRCEEQAAKILLMPIVSNYVKEKSMDDTRSPSASISRDPEYTRNRGLTHGGFNEQARVTQAIWDIIAASPNYSRLEPGEKSALFQIAHKIGRILTGDPHFEDHWEDIAGYADAVIREVLRTRTVDTRTDEQAMASVLNLNEWHCGSHGHPSNCPPGQRCGLTYIGNRAQDGVGPEGVHVHNNLGGGDFIGGYKTPPYRLGMTQDIEPV